MSLTSYRAAPPRDGPVRDVRVDEIVNGFRYRVMHVARASMPGDDLLFHRLSDSTIGAGGFHGRVRNGIGWDTDAIATRQWSRCDMRHCDIWVPHLGLCSLGEGFKIDTVQGLYCGDQSLDGEGIGNLASS